MPYIASHTRESGCLFCNRLRGDDDVGALILHRGQHAFVIMNLFPYNTGHLMIVPNAHVSTPEDLDSAATIEMARARAPVLRVLRRVLKPDGFNLGLNVGTTAGAGVADHLHEHVVPRWSGDANFMPIVAATTVMPELIPVTYAKLRAEFAREFDYGCSIAVAVISGDGDHLVIDDGGQLPVIAPAAGEPIWRTVLWKAERSGAIEPEILGWIDSPFGSTVDGTVVVRGSRIERARTSTDFRIVNIGDVEHPHVTVVARKARAMTRGG